ncbi:MAG: hypothetical protein HYX74_06380, partial [Acidobacteria bacterium]|nr:hypothetical protein [Acidobacteriota bacterium]
RQGVTSAGDVRGFEQSCISYLNPLYVLPRLPNMSAAHIAQQLNVQGPNNTSVFDSAAALQAIGEGARWIQRGDADLVLAGGADTRVTPLTLLSLEQCDSLLSHRPGAERAPAPFDLDRDGFALGEGAGVVLMEEYEHSRQRGVRPYAEIAGYASATDPAPIGQMNDKGAALSRAIEEALQEARCSHVDGIFAAGLATRQHDLGESAAIHSALGRKAAVTALKGALGNTMTAAGGIEVALAVRVLAEGVLPPIPHLRQPDPECDLNCVMDVPRPGEYRTILINAVALAGLNCALILKRV